MNNQVFSKQRHSKLTLDSNGPNFRIVGILKKNDFLPNETIIEKVYIRALTTCMHYFIDHQTPPILHFSKHSERFLFKKLFGTCPKIGPVNQAWRFSQEEYSISVQYKCMYTPTKRLPIILLWTGENRVFFEIHSKLGPIQSLALYQ